MQDFNQKAVAFLNKYAPKNIAVMYVISAVIGIVVVSFNSPLSLIVSLGFLCVCFPAGDVYVLRSKTSDTAVVADATLTEDDRKEAFKTTLALLAPALLMMVVF